MIVKNEIRWEVLSRASAALEDVRVRLGPEGYERQKAALQDFLCGYFNTGSCRNKQGNQISPMASSSTSAGGKCLKGKHPVNPSSRRRRRVGILAAEIRHESIESEHYT